MYAGFASCDITPAIGTWLNGFIARVTPATGVDIPLAARLLWLEDDQTKCLIVTLDVLGLSTVFADCLTQNLANRLNLPESNIVIACSHTHSGPMSCRLRGIGRADEEYLCNLESRILGAASQAAVSTLPVEVAWGESPLEISVNRRQIDPATGKSVLGRNPDGPTDRSVKVLYLRGEGFSAALFNYACHPYCLGPEHTTISPDFPGHAVAFLEARGYHALFLNGCSGDIAPLRACEGPCAAKSEGEKLAEAVILACKNATVEKSASLQANSVRFQLDHDDLPSIDWLAQEIKKSDNTVRPEDRQDQRVLARVQAAWDEWLADLRTATENGQPLPLIPARVSLVRVGSGAIVALPGELFYEIGERIARHIRATHVCVAAYCHGYIGYVPTRSAYPQGGYEVEESHRFVSLWRVSSNAESTIGKQVNSLCADLSH